MNNAHLHLIVNHFPIVGTILGTIILIAGIIFKKTDIIRTALAVFIFTALMAIVSTYTGNEAEDIIENLPDISETLLHSHEELAEVFLPLSLILGATSLLAIIMEIRKIKYAKYVIYLVLLLAISNGVLAKFVGNSGGEIRHTEIRSTAKIIHLHNDRDDD